MDNVSFLQDHTLRMAKAKRRAQKSGSRDVTAALKALRERAGLTMSEMAKELGYKGASSYQRYEDPALYKKDYLPVPLMRMLLATVVGRGNPPITAEELAELGPFTSPSRRHAGLRAPMALLGEVQAGIWREVEENQEVGHIPVALVDLTARHQYALTVRGESMNKVARDGDYLICLDLMGSGATPVPGDLVVVERTRDDGSIREVTVKRLLEEFDGTLILMPESTDNRYQQPLSYADAKDGDTSVAVKAIVLAVLSLQHQSVKARFSSS